MKNLVLILALVSVVFSQEDLGLGFPTTPGQFPWTVSIVNIATSGNETECSGSIISETWVMTTASCYDPSDETVNYRLSFGGVDLDNPEVVQLSNQFIPFPTDAGLFNYNVALIQLSTPLVFSTTIAAISLGSRSNADNLWETTEATVVGIIGDDRVEGKLVRWNTVEVIDRETCEASTYVYPNEICSTGTALNVNQSPCFPTSGYAIAVFENNSWVQIGLGSYFNFCSADSPQIFLRLGPFLDWISTVTAIDIAD